MLTTQQNSAVEKLSEWKIGALFMQPGTGKTRTALTLVGSTPCTEVFWIGPLRTISAIGEEVERWGGWKVSAFYYGVESLSASDRIYMELVERVEASKIPCIVVDESLKIKNVEAKRTKRVLELSKKAQYKLVLNGTPISRNLLDIWPQMEFLSPQILKMSFCQFKNTFLRWTKVTKRDGGKAYTKEYIVGVENVDYLYSLIRYYVYECDLQLNIAQKWKVKHYRIGEEERSRYQEIKERYLSDEMLEWRSNNIFMAMTTELQMAYALCQEKIDAVKSIFADEGAEPSETIIFCRFVACRELCKKAFPECTVLSLQKESLGLNLQQFSNTIYFDKVWDYALYFQSTRRTFRTGQEKDCRYWELTGDVGLERLIDNNIRKKINLSEYLKRVALEDLKREL